MKKYTLGSSKEEVLRMIPERVIKKIILGNRSVGIVREVEIFTCFEEFCPHRGASLIQGSINAAGELICPLHAYRFELQTGKLKSGSCRDLSTFPVFLSENGLEITLP